jgi:hypothetical protein
MELIPQVAQAHLQLAVRAVLPAVVQAVHWVVPEQLALLVYGQADMEVLLDQGILVLVLMEQQERQEHQTAAQVDLVVQAALVVQLKVLEALEAQADREVQQDHKEMQ